MQEVVVFSVVLSMPTSHWRWDFCTEGCE